jgi:hypothetical protein
LNVESDLFWRRYPSWPKLVTINVSSQVREARLAEQSAPKKRPSIVFPSCVLNDEELRPEGSTTTTHLRGVDIREPTAILAALSPKRLLFVRESIVPDVLGEVLEVCGVLAPPETEVVIFAFAGARLGGPTERAQFPAASPDMKLPFRGTALACRSGKRFVSFFLAHI